MYKGNWRKILIHFLFNLSGSKIPYNLETIKKLGYIPEANKKLYQIAKLKKLLVYAYQNVPYYNDLLPKTGVINSNLDIELKYYQDIPLLTKDIIRDEFDRLCSYKHNSRKSFNNSTSGSTGEPVSFIQDKYYKEWNIASKLFYKDRIGHNIGDKEFRFWGSLSDIKNNNTNILKSFRDWVYNRHDFNTFLLNESTLNDIFSKWNSHHPQWIETYVHSLLEVCNEIETRKLALPSPKAILCTAGTLDDAFSKKASKLLNTVILNRYGSREVGDIACSDGVNNGLEVSYWNQYVEVLDSKLMSVKPGISGNVYVTCLNNYSMPFIRYDIGDIATPSSNWRFLKSVEGRKSIFFTSSIGEKVNVGYLRQILYDSNWIKKYQIIQTKINHIIFKIVVNQNSHYSDSDLREIQSYTQELMGKDCKVDFEFVSEIKPLSSGKFLFTISNVK